VKGALVGKTNGKITTFEIEGRGSGWSLMPILGGEKKSGMLVPGLLNPSDMTPLGLAGNRNLLVTVSLNLWRGGEG